MAYLLFVDESGHDQRSPYYVLAGAAVHDTQLWPLVTQIREAESVFFGSRITLGPDELKARKLLKTKVFKHASQMEPIPQPRRAELAASALADGTRVTREQLTALAQAKIDYCSFVLECCAASGVRFFASIVPPNAPRPSGTMLRKDYAYLFERFFYFVDDQSEHERGLVIFDEIERSKAHILVDQMAAYFQDTRNGRLRSSRIIPEPLFVHSDLSTLIQVADLVAYIVSWNVRFGSQTEPPRPELNALGQQVLRCRYKAVRSSDRFVVWSLAVIDDLRPRSEISFEQEFAERFGNELDRRLAELEAEGQ